MLFDTGYREDVTLGDGRPVVLRLIQPGDKAILQRGMSRLSPRSRWLRFHVARNDRFSARELAYLTEVDGVDHFAIIALDGDGGVAIARFVRSRSDPATAEPALTVLDDHQGKGLGRILLARLVAAARERGIDRFDAEVHASNGAMLKLFREISPALVERRDEMDIVSVEAQIRTTAVPKVRANAPASRAPTRS